jgi:hypothetical protein
MRRPNFGGDLYVFERQPSDGKIVFRWRKRSGAIKTEGGEI